MPLAKIEVSVEIEETKKQEILSAVSGAIATVTGKPESYVMVTLQESVIMMGGEQKSSAFVDIRGIGGLDPSTNGELSGAVCNILLDSLGIPGDCVYINFTDIAACNWGYDSRTFG